MSILSQDLDPMVDSEVRHNCFIQKYNPEDQNNNSWIGATLASISVQVPTRYKFHPLSKSNSSLKDGVLEITNTMNVFAEGNICWDEYGIERIKVPTNICFVPRPNQNLPKEIEADTINIKSNYEIFSGHRIKCEKFVLSGLFTGLSSEMSNCSLKCNTVLLCDMPHKFVNVSGEVQTLHIKCMSLSDIDEYFGNHVIPQKVGPKKISKIADIRAFYNNPNKYNSYWVQPNTLYNADALINAMGLNDLRLCRLQIRDCNFVMTFLYNGLNNHWALAHCLQS